MKKPYYLYNELCEKIEQDMKSIKELKQTIKELSYELIFFQDFVEKSDIGVDYMVHYLLKNDLNSNQRRYINELIGVKVEVNKNERID